MKNMTSKQIRERIAEIEAEQAAHQTRDFDNELKSVMLAGGDVDQLENQQLEAERTARRLRVEAQALKAMLPDAVRTEVRMEIESLAEARKPDQKVLQQCIDELIAIDQRRLEIYADIDPIMDRDEAAMATARALTGLGRVSAHGEARGEEPIVSPAFAQELISLVTANAIDLSKLPERVRGQLHQHFSARAVERDRARHAANMQEISQQQAAAL